MAVTREDGWVAVKYLQNVPHVIRIGGDTKYEEYAFVVQHNVNITFVRPEHLDKVLAIKKHCCGNSSSPKYRLANEQDVRLWSL